MAVNEDGHRHLERARTGAAQPQHRIAKMQARQCWVLGMGCRVGQGCGGLKDHEDCDEVGRGEGRVAVKKP
jgi:hypothetical protein